MGHVGEQGTLCSFPQIGKGLCDHFFRSLPFGYSTFRDLGLCVTRGFYARGLYLPGKIIGDLVLGDSLSLYQGKDWPLYSTVVPGTSMC